MNESTRNQLVALIMSSTRIINERQYAEDIGLLKRDLRDAQERHLSWVASDVCRALVPDAENAAPVEPPPDYLYFTLPLTDLKQDMYKLAFNSTAVSLSGKAKAKIGRILNQLIDELGFKLIPIPPTVLHAHHLHTVYKVDMSLPVCWDIIEHQRLKKPDEGHKVAFVSMIAGKSFNNMHSKNEKHPRVYNMFTSMTSSLRHYTFDSVYGVNMVEVDFTNAIVQCLAKMAKCPKMLNAIEHNTLLSARKSVRREEKGQMLRWVFSLLSEKVSTASKNRRQAKLYDFLLERIGDINEVKRFISTIRGLDSPHDLFHYEDILRDFCKAHPCAINLHDAVYIPAEETELIKALTDELDSQGYLYQVTKH